MLFYEMAPLLSDTSLSLQAKRERTYMKLHGMIGGWVGGAGVGGGRWEVGSQT